MTREVTTTGSKKIKTLYKEFNEHFPYLRLKLLSSTEFKKSKEGKTVYGLDIEKTLSEVREKTGAGKISFSGRKKIETVKKNLKKSSDSIYKYATQKEMEIGIILLVKTQKLLLY